MNVNVMNIVQVSYDDLYTAIEPYFRIQAPRDILDAQADAFFAALPEYYGYLVGLWSRLDYEVRDNGDKTQISKRDLIDKALSTIKFMYEVTSRRHTIANNSYNMNGEKYG